MKNNLLNEEISQDVAKRLIESDAYSVDFEKDRSKWTKLPDGTITPCYCNCRYINRFPLQTKAILNYLECILRINFKDVEIIVGLATAGIPLAALLADRFNLPLCYVRSKSKGYGQGNFVEGNPPKGLKAVVIDDVLFTGISVTRSIDALKSEYNTDTIGVLTIVSLSSWDCKENEWQYFKSKNIRTFSLTSFEYILDSMLQKKKITKEQKDELENYYLKPKSHEWK